MKNMMSLLQPQLLFSHFVLPLLLLVSLTHNSLQTAQAATESVASVGAALTPILTRSIYTRETIANAADLPPSDLRNDGSVLGVPATISTDHLVAGYDFEDGLEGWANANPGSTGMGAEIWHEPGSKVQRDGKRIRGGGGVMRIETLAGNLPSSSSFSSSFSSSSSSSSSSQTSSYVSPYYPWIDSPLGDFRVSDATYVVFRMKHLGGGGNIGSTSSSSRTGGTTQTQTSPTVEGAVWFRRLMVDDIPSSSSSSSSANAYYNGSDFTTLLNGNTTVSSTSSTTQTTVSKRLQDLAVHHNWPGSDSTREGGVADDGDTPFVPFLWNSSLYPDRRDELYDNATEASYSRRSYWERRFPIIADGKWHMYAVPILPLRSAVPSDIGRFTQMRVFPLLRSSETDSGVGSGGGGGGGGAVGDPNSNGTADAQQQANVNNTGSGASTITTGNTMGTILIDFIRVASAPTILRVEGCGRFRRRRIQRKEQQEGGMKEDNDVQYPEETELIPPMHYPAVRKGYPLNQYYATIDDALQRVNASNDASLPYASTYSCHRSGKELRLSLTKRSSNDKLEQQQKYDAGKRVDDIDDVDAEEEVVLGGELITISGVHLGSATSPPRVSINGLPCLGVQMLYTERQVVCRVPPGSGLQLAVTVANGDMPLLADHKPFFSYANGPKAPPRPVISNINARAVDVTWLSPQDHWESMMTSGYIVQWRSAILDDHTVGDTSSKITEAYRRSVVLNASLYNETISMEYDQDHSSSSSSSFASENMPPATGALIGAGSAGYVATRPIGTDDDPSTFPGLSAPVVYLGKVLKASVEGGTEAMGIVASSMSADETFVGSSSSVSSVITRQTSSGVYTRGVVPSIISTQSSNPLSSTSSSSSPPLVAPDVVWGPWGNTPGGGEVIVVNQTTTTILPLEPGRRYQFRVAALNEPVIGFSTTTTTTWSKGDLYGHRRPLPGAVRGPWSAESEDIRTLVYDIYFSRFDANATLDHGPVYLNSTTNGLHWPGGEGHYGLILIGSAQIGNCNISHSCCDGFGAAEGGGGGGKFYDMIRYLDAWAQEGTHSPTYTFDNTYIHAPLYRYDTDTFDFTPIPLEWNGVYTNQTDTTSHFNRSSYPPLGSSEDLNTGTLQALLQSANVGAHSRGAKESDASSAGDVAGASRRPVLHRERLLSSADSLLASGLGKPPSQGTWFSILKEEGTSVWDEYDDAGTLAFVPQSLIDQLDAEEETAAAQASAAAGAGTDGTSTATSSPGAPADVGGGIQWAGIYNDSRASWNEAIRNGPLHGDDSSNATTSPSTNVNDGGDSSNNNNNDNTTQMESLDPASLSGRSFARKMQFQHGTSTSTSTTTTTTTNNKNTPKRPLIHRDRFGRRMVGLEFDPTSTCTLVCAAATGAMRSPVLNNQAQRGTDIYPNGVYNGVSSGDSSSSSSSSSSHSGSSSRSSSPSYVDDHQQAYSTLTSGELLQQNGELYSDLYNGRSGVGASSIFGILQVGRNLTLIGTDFRSGKIDTRAPIAGRYGGDGSAGIGLSTADRVALGYQAATTSAGGDPSKPAPPQPYPDTTNPTTITILPASLSGATLNVTAPCGPVLRLTGSRSSAAGAAWYARPQQVREGFDTTFIFRLANPSVHCRSMNDAYTRCRSRGGNGFAFVIQASHPGALGVSNGAGRQGLGYEGIGASVAIEFDTWADAEQLDPGENHVSVHSRGVGAANSANHTFSLGVAPFSRVPDLTDGIHIVRIVYDPVLTASHVMQEGFKSTAHTTDFFTNEAYANGGSAQWSSSKESSSSGSDGRSGIGALTVYIDDENEPILIIPLQLPSLLGLDETHGRAWVGFTAATGEDVWQNHDILGWYFTQLRLPYRG